MSAPVSIVIPALDDAELLFEALRPLARELERREAGDELLVVDDSGEDRLAALLERHFPMVRCLASSENLGFARALTAGIRAARHELVLALNSDVRVRPGFLEPLVDAVSAADSNVFAAVPRILLRGEPRRIESLVVVRLEHGIARAAQPALEEPGGLEEDEETLGRARPVPFAIGGACLFRRARFEELGGFDPAFEPFYLEDLDLGWRAWKAGLGCLYVGASIVEHRHRGTIGPRVPEAVVLAAIERNRLLFTWKHLDEPRLRREHVRELARLAAEATVTEDRAFLGALCLALEDRGQVLRAAGAAAAAEPSFARVRDASDPFGEA